MALDPTDMIELLFAPRFAIPFGIAVAVGLGIYLIGGRTPALAAVASGIGLVGLGVGVIRHVAGGRKPGAA